MHSIDRRDDCFDELQRRILQYEREDPSRAYIFVSKLRDLNRRFVEARNDFYRGIIYTSISVGTIFAMTHFNEVNPMQATAISMYAGFNLIYCFKETLDSREKLREFKKIFNGKFDNLEKRIDELKIGTPIIEGSFQKVH